MEILTLAEAIEKGHTHFIEEEGERLEEFAKLDEFNKEYFKTKKCFIVDMQNPQHYSISADTIKDLISDYVAGQEEVADEDENLFNVANEHDYSKVAEELNEKFKQYKYYALTTTQVIF